MARGGNSSSTMRGTLPVFGRPRSYAPEMDQAPIPTPPRRSGRHHVRNAGPEETQGLRYPDEDVPTDPTMPAPLNDAPRERRPAGAYRMPPWGRPDVIVPRVTVIP